MLPTFKDACALIAMTTFLIGGIVLLDKVETNSRCKVVADGMCYASLSDIPANWREISHIE